MLKNILISSALVLCMSMTAQSSSYDEYSKDRLIPGKVQRHYGKPERAKLFSRGVGIGLTTGVVFGVASMLKFHQLKDLSSYDSGIDYRNDYNLYKSWASTANAGWGLAVFVWSVSLLDACTLDSANGAPDAKLILNPVGRRIALVAFF